MSETGGGPSLFFPTAPARLGGTPFGAKIKDGDGNRRDTNVQPAVDEILSVLMTAGVFNLTRPLEINYSGQGAAIRINSNGPDAVALELNARYAGLIETLRLGIAENSTGIVASDVLPAGTPLNAYNGRSINNSVDVMWELLRKFFGQACAADGEPSLGADGLEQLAETGHGVMPDYDRTKAQVLWHDEDSDCLKWLGLDTLLCTLMESLTGYDDTKTQVIGHVSGTCQMIDVGDCA